MKKHQKSMRCPQIYSESSSVCECVCVYNHLCSAENRLLGLSKTGPCGNMVPLSLTQCR